MTNSGFQPHHFLISWTGLRLTKTQYQWVTQNIRDFNDWKDLLGVFKKSRALEYAQKLAQNPAPLFRSLEEIENRGARLVTLGEHGYPDDLNSLERPPLVLTVRGELPKSISGVGVVGSRSPSAYSTEWLDSEFSEFLRQTHLATISGGARGIDQACHLASIRLGLPTYVFLPSGILNPYPANIAQLEHKIISCGGGLISIFEPHLKIFRQNFHFRNEIIARLSKYLLVVEARRKSGTLVTAGFAQSMEGGLGVVPCSPFDQGRGGLDLIQQGADMICDHEDLILAISKC